MGADPPARLWEQPDLQKALKSKILPKKQNDAVWEPKNPPAAPRAGTIAALCHGASSPRVCRQRKRPAGAKICKFCKKTVCKSIPSSGERADVPGENAFSRLKPIPFRPALICGAGNVALGDSKERPGERSLSSPGGASVPERRYQRNTQALKRS